MKQSMKYWGLLAALLSAVFWVLSIPPFEAAEAAYVAFVPLLLWCAAGPSWRAACLVGMLTAWPAWFVILIWLRHVTWGGLLGLSGILALLFTLWCLAAAAWLPRLTTRPLAVRVLGFAGLAGLWVVLEWARTWLLWGFPWAPLSLSQWQRPVVLQMAAWTGAYGVSFMLIFFNCCVAQTLRKRVVQRERKLWTGWFSPDLYLAMGILGLCLYLFFKTLPEREAMVPILRAGVVQPYIPPELKWDTARELENLAILERQTRFVANLESDVILWPEAATPWPVAGYLPMQARVEALVNELGKPILMGNLSNDPTTDIWQNGIFLVEPGTGLSAQSYAKRELVPFGEYVPPPFGFIDTFVPLEGSFVPGDEVGLIELQVGEAVWRVGPLVCYEDVFAPLVSETVRAGADLLFVATNNAWYGEEGGAEQHAAHSVLRAVENRRPVMRCGNGGWSGWIDAYGTVREPLLDERGSIFFRGGGSYAVFQYDNWLKRQSFYTRRGDWFVAGSGLFCLFAWMVARRR